jgi:hypothetical protein
VQDILQFFERVKGGKRTLKATHQGVMGGFFGVIAVQQDLTQGRIGIQYDLGVGQDGARREELPVVLAVEEVGRANLLQDEVHGEDVAALGRTFPDEAEEREEDLHGLALGGVGVVIDAEPFIYAEHVLATSQEGIHGSDEEIGALAGGDGEGDLGVGRGGTLEDGLDDLDGVGDPIVLDGGDAEAAVETDTAAVEGGKGAVVEEVGGDLKGFTGKTGVVAAQAEVI